MEMKVINLHLYQQLPGMSITLLHCPIKVGSIQVFDVVVEVVVALLKLRKVGSILVFQVFDVVVAVAVLVVVVVVVVVVAVAVVVAVLLLILPPA